MSKQQDKAVEKYLLQHTDRDFMVVCWGFTDAISHFGNHMLLQSANLSKNLHLVQQCFLHQIQEFLRYIVEEQKISNDDNFLQASIAILPAKTVTPVIISQIGNLMNKYDTQCVTILQNMKAPSTLYHFVINWKRFTSDTYEVTDTDMCLATFKCHSIVEYSFNYYSFKIRMMDVSRQRNERRVWVRQFKDNLSAQIYFLDMLSLFKELPEDDSVNQMRENMHLIEELCNSRWFQGVPLLIILVHVQQFEQLVTSIAMQQVFTGYTDPSNNAQAALQYITNRLQELPQGKRSRVIVQSHDPSTAQASNNLGQNLIRNFHTILDGGLLL